MSTRLEPSAFTRWMSRPPAVAEGPLNATRVPPGEMAASWAGQFTRLTWSEPSAFMT
jgi:hypothetical protein